MKPSDDPFLPLADSAAQSLAADDFAALAQRPVAQALRLHMPVMPVTSPAVSPTLAVLHGFDLLDQPVLSSLSAHPGELVSARSATPLLHQHIGRQVLVLFADGDTRQPIITGVIETQPLRQAATTPAAVVADGTRQLIEAEREVVLRCGDASITLTRAGKVIIKGHYILSRSSGANKIKGAAVDIN